MGRLGCTGSGEGGRRLGKVAKGRGEGGTNREVMIHPHVTTVMARDG